MDKAKNGGGPTLIEAFTYRMGDHTTSDDASRYRAKAELEAWAQKDPLVRFKRHLVHKGLWDDAFETETQSAATALVEKAVAEAEARPGATVDDIFAYTYAEMPPDLEAQRAELQTSLGEDGR